MCAILQILMTRSSKARMKIMNLSAALTARFITAMDEDTKALNALAPDL